MTVAAVAAGVASLGMAAHGVSVTLAARRAWRARRAVPKPARVPPVSVVQPLCGVDEHSRETLEAILSLDYPDYEVLFCVADPNDPIIAIAREAIAAHPERRAAILVGDDKISHNPKLNNVVKGWRAARRPWVAIVDSNVLTPPDYLHRLRAAWRNDTGIVCAPPIGARPESFAAAIECAFLNTYQARWQFTADSLGFGFAQGKTLFWKRDVLEAGGGIEALAAELAEDAASTKLVRRQGLRARLADASFGQPLGRRRWREVWARQARWARLRRATFAPYFAPEILTTSLVPILSAGLAAYALGGDPALAMAAIAILWYGAEALLAYLADWPRGLQMLFASAARDLLLPYLWLQAWSGDEFVWRGHAMSVAPKDDEHSPDAYQQV